MEIRSFEDRVSAALSSTTLSPRVRVRVRVRVGVGVRNS